MCTQQTAQKFRDKQRAVLLGAALNLPLAIIKIVVGFFGASQALIADGIDSTADVICDSFVIGAVRISHHRADVDHPYGHARIETAATTLVSIMLLLTAGLVGAQGVRSLLAEVAQTRPSYWALVVAAMSVALKESMYWYTLTVGKKVNSALIKTNAWHHRSDALTSLVALIAIAGSLLGFTRLDAVGSIIIAGVIATIGLRYGWESLTELVDTGLKPERIAEIERQILSVPGVRQMRRLRTRTMGGYDAFADVGVLVDADLSLTEAHRISEAISASLIADIEEVTDLCIHIEPAGYADSKAAHTLPLREQVWAQLRLAWRPINAAQKIRSMQLHYLDQEIAVELVLPLSLVAQAQTLQQQFERAVDHLDYISSVHILYGQSYFKNMP